MSVNILPETRPLSGVLARSLLCLVLVLAAASRVEAQLINEIIRGAINGQPTDTFGCGNGSVLCDLGYRMYSAADPSEVNGPANPVDGIPSYRSQAQRYLADAQITGNFPVAGSAGAGNEWYIVWDGITGSGTSDHAGWYGAQAQKIYYNEIGNSQSGNCLPVIAAEACFAALDDTFNGSNDTVRADGSPLLHVGGISPIPCPQVKPVSADTLSLSWTQALNYSVRDGATVPILGYEVFVVPDPTGNVTETELDTNGVLAATINDPATTSVDIDLAAQGIGSADTYVAALKLLYPGGKRSEHYSCNSPLAERFLPVTVDIKPDSDTNPVDPMSQGVIPVQILGSETFDVTEIDRTSLAFGPAGAVPVHDNGGHLQASKQGFGALLSHYATPETGIALGDTEACVTGEMLDGTPFEGCDTVRTVPPE